VIEPDELPPPTPAVAAVLKANERFYQAIETADLDLMREVWVPPEVGEAAAHCVHPGQAAVHGVGKILRSWALVLARMSYLQFFLTDVRVVLIEAVAVVTCVENILSNLPGDEAGQAGFAGSHYEAVNVYRRESDGGWRLLAHSSAPVFPTSTESTDAE